MIILSDMRTDNNVVSGEIRIGRQRRRIEMSVCPESAPVELRASSEAFLMLALPVALKTGLQIRVDAPVDSCLLNNIAAISDQFRAWDPNLQPIKVTAAERRRSDAQKSGSGAGLLQKEKEIAFFTCGVDSFYTAQQRPEADLLYVFGLDVPGRQTKLGAKVAISLEQCATRMQRPLVVMESNLRELTDEYLSWHYSWGCGLAACAQTLGQAYSRFSVSTSYSERDEIIHGRVLPDGGHPVLQPLFSTRDVTLRSIGGNARRVDKIGSIADWTVAQDSLRVCWENRGGAYNCGACEKCIRTMVALDALNRLGDFPVFDRPLNDHMLARTVHHDPVVASFVAENIETARSNGARPELIRSLETSLGHHPWYRRFLSKHVPRQIRGWLYHLGL